MSLICLAMINKESNLTLNFNGSVLTESHLQMDGGESEPPGGGRQGGAGSSGLTCCAAAPLPPRVGFSGAGRGRIAPWWQWWGQPLVAAGGSVTQCFLGFPSAALPSNFHEPFKSKGILTEVAQGAGNP